MKPLIKIAAAVLLLLCLIDMPYNFGTMLRIAISGAFVFLSYDYFRDKSDGLGFVFAGLALLFQPFYKIALSHSIWSVIHIVVVIGLVYLIISAFGDKKRTKRRRK